MKPRMNVPRFLKDNLVSNKWRWMSIIASALVLYSSYSISEPSIGYDGAQYLKYAENLISKSAFTFDGVNASCGRAPGYPTFIAAFLLTFHGIEWVYPVQFLFLLAAYILVAWAYESQALRAGLTLLLLTVIWPMHRLSASLLTEPMFIAMTCLGLFLILRHIRSGKLAPLVVAGLMLGLSALVRPVNLLAAPFLALVLIWRRKLSLGRGALLAVVGILVIVPWTVRNWIQFDRIVPIASHHGSIYYMTDEKVFWGVLFRSAGSTHSLPVYQEIVGDDLELDWEANQRYWQRARENIARDPFGFLGRCTAKTVFIWSYLPGTKGWLFTAWPLFAVGVGIQFGFLYAASRGLRSMANSDSTLPLIVIGYAIYTTGVLFPFYAESRMLLPVYVWLFGAASHWILIRVVPSR